MKIDSRPFFEDLAAQMNADPDRYRRLGEAYLSVGIVMAGFRVRLDFDGLRCDVADTDDVELCDFRLEGPTDAWQEMFDDIATHGRAEGLHTVNSLVLMGDRIVLRGRDPMGLDKFSRFNQTLQELLDGRARLEPVSTTT